MLGKIVLDPGIHKKSFSLGCRDKFRYGFYGLCRACVAGLAGWLMPTVKIVHTGITSLFVICTKSA